MLKKTIAHITSAHPPFDIRILRKECRSLANAGYRVTLIAPHVRDDMVDGVSIIAVPPAGRRLHRMTVTTSQVYRKALRLNAELYHFHDSELIPVGLLLRARGYKVIYDIHEDVPRDLVTRDYLPGYVRPVVCALIKGLENWAACRFSAVITATPAIGRRFQALNPRAIVVNNYPMRNELIPSITDTWDKRAPAVVYLGGISTERGIMEMVQAMELVPASLGAGLELAGSFSDPGQRERARDLPGWGHVKELGILGRAQVAGLLSKVRAGLVLFHPVPNHVEAQPNKLFEYMSAGIPVIASDFPLWRELIEREGCGLLVNPLDPQAIAGAIEYVLTHPVEAEAMGRCGRKAVEARYNWETESPKLLELYATLLGGK